MIKQSSIDELRRHIDIIDIVGRFINLKRAGANHTGLCPFHNEKSPSFTVSPAKQIYKCFGCGVSGDAITFIKEHERKSYPEALQHLADIYNIELEQDQQATAQTQETIDKRTEIQSIINWAARQYEAALPTNSAALNYLHSRGYNDERIKSWSMGYAPADFKFLTTPIINMGKHSPAVEAGIVVSRDGKNHDFLINRITMPIHDHNGIITGFAGRIIPTGDAAADNKYAKWMNPPESTFYKKRNIWYGLWQAQKEIQKQKFAYLVEGYPDVHAMQDSGCTNTIAPCGTQIHDDQILFLKRYTDEVCFVGNTDDAGVSAVMKSIDKFLAFDFKVSCIHLPETKDADEYIRLLNEKNIAA